MEGPAKVRPDKPSILTHWDSNQWLSNRVILSPSKHFVNFWKHFSCHSCIVVRGGGACVLISDRLRAGMLLSEEFIRSKMSILPRWINPGLVKEYEVDLPSQRAKPSFQESHYLKLDQVIMDCSIPSCLPEEKQNTFCKKKTQA